MSKIKLIYLFSILTIGSQLISQTPFSKVSDYNYHQHNTFTLIEVDSFIYTVGNVLEKGLEKREEKPYIGIFDTEGTSIDHKIYEDDNEFRSYLNLARDVEHVNGVLYFPYSERSGLGPDNRYDYQGILFWDEKNYELGQHHTVQDTLNDFISPSAKALSKNKFDHLLFLLSISEGTRGIYLQEISSEISGKVLQQFRFEHPEHEFIPFDILVSEDHYIIIGYFRRSDIENHSGLFAMKLNEDFELVQEAQYSNLRYFDIYMNGTVGNQGEVIFLTNESTTNTTGLRDYRPIITRINSDLEIDWQLPFGYGFSKSNNRFHSVIASHDALGYVLTGVGSAPDSLVTASGIIGKVSSEGDSVWFRNVYPPEEYNIFKSELYEVVKTADGHYVSVGQAAPRMPPDSIYSKDWLYKFDEEGHTVLIDTTSSVVTATLSDQLRIFPNPVADLLYIENDAVAGLSYILYDETGAEVLSRRNTNANSTYIVSVEHLAAAKYYMHIVTGDGRREVKPIVVVR